MLLFIGLNLPLPAAVLCLMFIVSLPMAKSISSFSYHMINTLVLSEPHMYYNRTFGIHSFIYSSGRSISCLNFRRRASRYFLLVTGRNKAAYPTAASDLPIQGSLTRSLHANDYLGCWSWYMCGCGRVHER